MILKDFTNVYRNIKTFLEIWRVELTNYRQAYTLILQHLSPNSLNAYRNAKWCCKRKICQTRFARKINHILYAEHALSTRLTFPKLSHCFYILMLCHYTRNTITNMKDKKTSTAFHWNRKFISPPTCTGACHWSLPSARWTHSASWHNVSVPYHPL